MPLGFDRELTFSKNDTADLYANIYDTLNQQLVPQDDLVQVNFTIQKPDETTEVSQIGQITDDGTGYTRYTGTDQIGHYPVIAQFMFNDGMLASVRADFQIIDPLNPPAPSVVDQISDAVWSKLEDCFDGDREGPWLRQETLNHFSKVKMPEFISEGLFYINVKNPPTTFDENYFLPNGQPSADFPLFISGVFLPVLRHLMRSYTEQANPTGANVLWEDRRDYVDRWQKIYKIEQDWFKENLSLWKRQFLGLGRGKLLIDSKAGRLTPAPLRTRFVGRGYY